MITAALILMIVVISLGFDLLFPGMPWYTAFIIAFIAGLISSRKKSRPFLVGFAGVAVFWTMLLLILHFRNDGLLAGKISALLSGQMGFSLSPLLLMIITVLIGAILGGLSSLSGNLIAAPVDRAQMIRKRRRKGRSTYKLKI
jgi:hypothetical protein